MRHRAGCVGGPASVLTTVDIVHRAQDEDAGPGANHGGGQGWA